MYSFYLKRLPLQPVTSERNHQVKTFVSGNLSGNLFEVKTVLFALSIWYRATLLAFR